MMAQQKTKIHILESTINAIEKHGVQNLTTRIIAQEAGVNNAALHYYYGTKERLIGEALEHTLSHMIEDTDEILSRDDDIETRLRALFEYLVDGVYRFPNLIRSHLSGPLMEGESDSPLYRMMDVWLERTCSELGRVMPQVHKDTLRISMYVALTAIIVAGFMSGPAGRPSSIDLEDEAVRARYIDFIVGSILHRS